MIFRFLIGAAMFAGAAVSAQPADPRPVYHFAPASNWMNDPNGLVFYDGEYHLFFQHNPYGDTWGHMSWGHAVSRDLMTWEELPVAIPETDVMAFSGNAVIDWNNTSGLGKDGRPPMVALYTGANPKTGNQSQYLAYSNDRGRTFTIHGKVLDIGSTEFRDPKMFWHAGTERWIMAVVLAADNKVSLYTSPDLKAWTHASDFGPVGARGKNWECPDLFELPVEGRPGEKRWVLSVNLGDSGIAGGSGGQYFVGDFDGRRFTLDPSWGTAPVWMDHGADFYAAVTWSDIPAEDGRRIWIGWANNWSYAHAIPTWPSRGLMTLPRTLTLRRTPAGYRLVQTPVRETELLRRDPRSATDIRLGARPVSLPVEGGAVEIEIEIDAGSADQVILTLADEQGYRTLIGINPTVGEMFLDRTRSGPHFHDAFPVRHSTPIRMRNGRAKLRMFVDQSIVEIYADEGETTLTDRFFRGGGALSWTASARNGTAIIRSLKAWQMTGSSSGRAGVRQAAVIGNSPD